MLGIIGAMEVETVTLCGMLENAQTKVISGIKFTEGILYNKPVVVSQCNEGKVNSAIAAQTMILIYKADKIINTGVGGGLLPEMNVCDIAVAQSVVQHDFDLTPLGYEPGYITNVGNVYIPCNSNMCDSLYTYAAQIENTKAFKGVIVSGDQFINSSTKQKQLQNDFNAICTEMEGASIGQVCYLNNVDFCVLRAISDKADDDSNMDFKEFVEKACEKTVSILTSYIKNVV